MKTLLSVIGLLGLLSLAGCGQKGELQQAPEVAPPAPEQSSAK